MKRIISIALVALMLVALALPVVADEVNFGTNNSVTQNGEVTVTVTKDDQVDELVYKVDVEWDSLVFNYIDAIWSPDDLAYNGTWEGEKERFIKVTNSSNAPVYVSADKSGDFEVNGVKITIDNTSFTLASALTTGAAVSDSIKVTLDDENSMPTADNFTVTTITLTISKTDPNN